MWTQVWQFFFFSGWEKTMTMLEKRRRRTTCLLCCLYQCCLRLLIISAFSPSQRFFKDRGWCTCTSARVKLSPQRGGGWLNHETEMRDDEWLIKEVRWMTPNVTTASSVQSKQNMGGSALLHINQRTSESQMLTVLFLYNYTGLETWLHQFLPGDAECFWMCSALLECWDTRDSQDTPPF